MSPQYLVQMAGRCHLSANKDTLRHCLGVGREAGARLLQCGLSHVWVNEGRLPR